jgi:hypothetical protein
MHYMKNGTSVRPVGDLRQVSNILEPDVYEIEIVPMSGPKFEIITNMDLSVPKRVYGGVQNRVNKAFKAFDRRPLNTGILLSGDRGMGKTLFIRIAINEALARGIAVIILKQTDALDDVISLINRVSQPLLVIMDEFEKNFVIDSSKGIDSQMPFLSMLDGLGSNSKRMFIASINNLGKMNDFMLNRPGRFYYHFSYAKLSEDDMREYLKSETIGIDENTINYAVSMLQNYTINYDGLSAIAAELNAGCSIDETLQDLNLDREGESSLCFHIKVNGYDYTGYAYDSIESIRRRNHYTISFHSDKVYLPEKKMPKMSKHGFIGTSFDIHLEPVTALIDPHGNICLDTSAFSYISLDDDFEENGKTVSYLYAKDPKEVSNIIVKSRRRSHAPMYLTV